MTPPQSLPTPSERRRSQQREEARRTILDACEALLLEAGVDGLSMRRLASRCGYTAPTIYHHFGDKQGLLDEVVGGAYERVLTRARRARRDADPVRSLRALLTEFVAFGLENPAHHQVLNLPRPAGAPPLAAAEEIRTLLFEPLETLAGERRLRGGDVEEAVHFFWILLHGLVTLRTTRPDHEWSETLLDYALDVALEGMVMDTPREEPRAGREAS